MAEPSIESKLLNQRLARLYIDGSISEETYKKNYSNPNTVAVKGVIANYSGAFLLVNDTNMASQNIVERMRKMIPMRLLYNRDKALTFKDKQEFAKRFNEIFATLNDNEKSTYRQMRKDFLDLNSFAISRCGMGIVAKVSSPKNRECDFFKIKDETIAKRSDFRDLYVEAKSIAFIGFHDKIKDLDERTGECTKFDYLIVGKWNLNANSFATYMKNFCRDLVFENYELVENINRYLSGETMYANEKFNNIARQIENFKVTKGKNPTQKDMENFKKSSGCNKTNLTESEIREYEEYKNQRDIVFLDTEIKDDGTYGEQSELHEIFNIEDDNESKNPEAFITLNAKSDDTKLIRNLMYKIYDEFLKYEFNKIYAKRSATYIDIDGVSHTIKIDKFGLLDEIFFEYFQTGANLKMTASEFFSMPENSDFYLEWFAKISKDGRIRNPKATVINAYAEIINYLMRNDEQIIEYLKYKINNSRAS